MSMIPPLLFFPTPFFPYLPLPPFLPLPLLFPLLFSPSFPPSFPPSFHCHSRGIFANCADFFGFTCCQDSRSKVDWTKAYDMPKMFTSSTTITEDESAKLKFPMPYSSSWDPQRDNVGGRDKGGSSPSNGYVSPEDEQTCKQQFSASREFNI